MSRYAAGQPLHLTTTIKDVTGTLVNASTLALTVSKPDASTQVYSSPTNDSTGLYHQDVPTADVALLGHYQYVWQSTGTGAGVSYGDFDVFDPFEIAVLPLQDAKDSLNIPASITTNDSHIQSMIDTIEALLEMLTGGPLLTRTIVERVQVTDYYTCLIVHKRPLVAVQSIVDVSSGVALPVVSLDINANAGIIRRVLRLPFLSWGPYYTVTYTAGWGTSLPPAFNVAARIILQHLWKTQQGPQYRPYAGDEETVLPGMSFAIPNRALELLRPYTLEAFV